MKRILALAMTLALVFGLGVSAFADDHPLNTAEPKHGQTDVDSGKGAMISTEKSTYSTEGHTSVDAENNGLKTEFYMNIDRDAASDDGPINDVTVYAADKDGNKYIIDYTKQVKTSLALTVPLYVCMYAYGVDGKVVVPADDAYKIENGSKSKKTTNVERITRYYKTYDNLYELFTAESATNGWTSDGDIVDQTRNSKVYIHGHEVNVEYLQNLLASYGDGYVFYIKSEYQPTNPSADTDKMIRTGDDANYNTYTETTAGGYSGNANTKIDYVSVLLKSRCKQFDGDSNYYAEGESFYDYGGTNKTDCTEVQLNISGMAGELADVTGATNGLTVVTCGAYYPPEGKNTEGAGDFIACFVTGVEATTPAGWTLMPASRVGTLTKAGELIMSINGLDMYDVVQNGGSYDTSGENSRWFITAMVAKAGTDPVEYVSGSLNLVISASIAGGSVNSDGDVQVMTATYTITPETVDATSSVMGANGSAPIAGTTLKP